MASCFLQSVAFDEKLSPERLFYLLWKLYTIQIQWQICKCDVTSSIFLSNNTVSKGIINEMAHGVSMKYYDVLKITKFSRQLYESTWYTYLLPNGVLLLASTCGL